MHKYKKSSINTFVVGAFCILNLCATHNLYAQKQNRSSREEQVLSEYAAKADSCGVKGNYEEALNYINRAFESVKKPQKHEQYYYYLKFMEGFVLLQLDQPDYEQAIEAFKVVLQDKDRAVNVYPELGRAYLGIGDYSSAIQYLDLAVQNEEKRDSVDYYFLLRSEELLATAYMKNGEDDRASEILSSFLNKRVFLNHDDYFNLLLRAYNDIVVDELGNILLYDKVSLRILQELAQDTKEQDGYPTWYYAIFIGQEGQVAQALGNFSLAYECAISAINSYTPESGRPLHFFYSSAALAASRLKRYEEAHQYLEKAFELIEKEESTNRLFWEREIKGQRAILYLDEGSDYNAAITLLEELLVDDNIEQRAQDYYNLGLAYELVDKNKALDCFKEALKCFEVIDNHGVFYAKTLDQLGVISYNNGEHDNAIKYYELAIDIFRRRSDQNNFSYVSTLGHATIAANKLGQIGRAIAWGEESRRIQKGTMGYVDPEIWDSLLSAYRSIGDHEEYEQILKEYEIVSQQQTISKIRYLSEVVRNHLSIGDVENAISYFIKIDSLYRCLPSSYQVNFEELVHQFQNRLFPENDDLFLYYSQHLVESDSLNVQTRVLLRSLGNDCYNEKDYESALFFYKIAHEQYKKDFDYLYKSYVVAHYCEDHSFKELLKDDILAFVNDQYKNVVGLTDTEKGSAWLNSMQLQDLVFACRENSDFDIFLFNVLLRTKNFRLRSNDAIRGLLASSGDTDLQQNGEELKRVNRAIYEGQRTLLPEVMDSLRLREIEINRHIVSRLKDLSYFDALGGISFQTIANNLETNDVAIEITDYPIAGGKYGFGAFVISKGVSKPTFIQLCVEDEIERYIKIDPRKLYNKELPFSHELYDLIWAPLAKYLPTKCRVFISPSGALNTIALEAIATPDNKYMCDDHKIVRLSSTAEVCKDMSFTPLNKAAIFGGINYENSDYGSWSDITSYSDLSYLQNRSSDDFIKFLPGTLKEAESIAKLLKTSNYTTALYLGEEGSEEHFKALSGSDVSIIHIATHGFYQTEDRISRIAYYDEMSSSGTVSPLHRSGLLMAGCKDAWNGLINAGHEDGVLTANEISGLDLSNTQLVVMSACESGLGDISDDGVIGLQSGFKNAGVQSLIMTLWKVDDKATEILMTSFYSLISKGLSINEAFSQSRDRMKTSKKYNNPYYWAGFILLD